MKKENSKKAVDPGEVEMSFTKQKENSKLLNLQPLINVAQLDTENGSSRGEETVSLYGFAEGVQLADTFNIRRTSQCSRKQLQGQDTSAEVSLRRGTSSTPESVQLLNAHLEAGTLLNSL